MLLLSLQPTACHIVLNCEKGHSNKADEIDWQLLIFLRLKFSSPGGARGRERGKGTRNQENVTENPHFSLTQRLQKILSVMIMTFIKSEGEGLNNQ